MKKTLLITSLVLLGALGFTVNVQAATCDDVVWSASALERNPAIAEHCLEIVEKAGGPVVRLRARVVRQGSSSTVIKWQRPDGTWSPAERVFPAQSATADIEGQEVKINGLTPGQEVNVYIPSADNWSIPVAAPVVVAEPAAAAAPPPPPPPPPAEPEPEPAPAALPTTATQVSLFALLGGLFILLGGIIGVARMRL